MDTKNPVIDESIVEPETGDEVLVSELVQETCVQYVEEEIETMHPLEDVFDIESNTTKGIQVHRETQMVTSENYDAKDTEIETQFQEVFDAAMDAYDSHTEITEQVEGKFKARNAEVAVQFLNTALSAAKEKANLKTTNDKLNIERNKASGPKTLNQNLIVADRNDILKALTSTQD